MSRTFWCEIWSLTQGMNLPSDCTSTCCPAPGAQWSIRPPYLKVINFSLGLKISASSPASQFSFAVASLSVMNRLHLGASQTFFKLPSHLCSSHTASFSREGYPDRSGHGAGFVETTRPTQRSCDTLHSPVRLQTGLDSWGVEGAAERR